MTLSCFLMLSLLRWPALRVPPTSSRISPALERLALLISRSPGVPWLMMRARQINARLLDLKLVPMSALWLTFKISPQAAHGLSRLEPKLSWLNALALVALVVVVRARHRAMLHRAAAAAAAGPE